MENKYYSLKESLENSKKTYTILIVERRNNKKALMQNCIGGKTTCREKNQKR